MKFLIVFIAVLLVWRLPFLERSTESTGFKKWLSLWHKINAFKGFNRHVKYSLVVLVPTIIAVLGFCYIQPYFWGLATLVLEILLLVYVLIHADVSRHLDQYQQELTECNLEGAYEVAKKSLSLKESDEDFSTLNERVIKTLLYRWFSYFFLMIFWYVLADVGGVLLAWLSVQYAQENADDEKACVYLRILEFIPARLVGLTFVLAGNLKHSLPVWRHYLKLWYASNADLLFNIGTAALAEGKEQRQWSCANENAAGAAAELEEWQRLHFYSISIWLVVIAIATLGGWFL